MNGCPNCGKAMLYKATSCSCGWEMVGTSQSRPPEVVGVLADEIRRIGIHRTGLPTASVVEAARYWMSMNAQADERYESPREVPSVGKDGSRWVCPYHQRLLATLRAYTLMSKQDRQIVVSGVLEKKVWWRGDTVEHYVNIINESMRMRRVGIAAYRGAAASVAKKLFHEIDFEAQAEREAIQSEGSA